MTQRNAWAAILQKKLLRHHLHNLACNTVNLYLLLLLKEGFCGLDVVHHLRSLQEPVTVDKQKKPASKTWQFQRNLSAISSLYLENTQAS